jgi:hypothetical protein
VYAFGYSITNYAGSENHSPHLLNTLNFLKKVLNGAVKALTDTQALIGAVRAITGTQALIGAVKALTGTQVLTKFQSSSNSTWKKVVAATKSRALKWCTPRSQVISLKNRRSNVQRC